MATSYESAKVKCPFYKTNDRTGIYCEGTVKNSSIRLRFESIDGKNKKMNSCCNDCYEKCEIYEAIMKKYRE